MRPDPADPREWLRYARSDLAIARGPAAADVLLDALCFHAQQAVEKIADSVLPQ